MRKGIDPNQMGNASPWDSDWEQDVKEYLSDWLVWHNASTDMGRW